MSSSESGKHRGPRRLVSEVEPGQMARWDARAAALGMTWAAWVRAIQDESVSMPEVTIYGIREVGTDQIRFVGATALPLERRRKQGYPGKLGEWLAGARWEYVELERATVARSGEAEARWVAELGGTGLLFNAGAASAAALGEVCVPVGLKRETHAKAAELAALGHWSLAAFVQIAVEKLIDQMSVGDRVAAAPFVPLRGWDDARSAEGTWNPETRSWCSDCGQPQFMCPGGLSCSEGHGGAEPIYDAAEAARISRSHLLYTQGEAKKATRSKFARVGSAANPNSAFAKTRDDDDEASA